MPDPINDALAEIESDPAISEIFTPIAQPESSDRVAAPPKVVIEDFPRNPVSRTDPIRFAQILAKQKMDPEEAAELLTVVREQRSFIEHPEAEMPGILGYLGMEQA